MMARLKRVIKRWRVRRAAVRSSDPELALMKNLLKEGDVFVDVGANIGVYSYTASAIGAKSILFEPNPFFVRGYLAMELPNSTFFNLCLSDKFGVVQLSVPVDGFGNPQFGLGSIVKKFSEQRSISCVAATLDSLSLDGADVVKIDVEGAEELVLSGSQHTIERYFPSFIIEIEDRHNPGGISRIVRSLSASGYDCFSFERTSSQLFRLKFDSRFPEFDSSRFSNNFIFVKRPDIVQSGPFMSCHELCFDFSG